MPALEAHPRDAPPDDINARAPRNVPHSSGLATGDGMWVSDGPGKEAIQPLPGPSVSGILRAVSQGSTP